MATARPRQRFADIVEHIGIIRDFCEGVSREEFLASREKTFAVQLALLRISEAARKLGELAENVAPQIPWRDVRDFGNVIRHDYDRISDARTWEIVQNDLQLLQDACEQALDHPDLRDSR